MSERCAECGSPYHSVAELHRAPPVNRNVLLAEAVALLEDDNTVSHSLENATRRMAFLRSPALEAWRRETGRK